MPPRRRPSPNDPEAAGSGARTPPVGGSEVDAWSPDSTSFVEGYDVREEPTSALVGVGVPAVVAVVVTRDAGPTLEATLASIAAQEYANLTTLVIDANSSEDPTGRVAAVAPNAFVKRFEASGYAAAANQALGTIEGASFFLFCHDDVELGSGTVQALVEEAFRSNAGVVGAKLVDWDAPDHLRSVGSTIDKFGFVWPNAEPGELDQEQHDAVRDTFLVSTATMLVRCDLFGDLGGFAADLDGYGEDLDLCWRARIAGARTVITPAARVRHLEGSAIGESAGPTERVAQRSRARIVLANYSPLHVLRIAPQALLFAFGEMLASLLMGRTGPAKDILAAIGWNIAHLPETLRIRGRVKRSRRTQDHEIRRLQVKGSTRLTAFVRRQTATDRPVVGKLAEATRSLTGDDEASVAPGLWSALAVFLTALLLIVGSRQLITGGVPVVREFLPLGDPTALLREWWAGWRTPGMGSATAAPTIDLVAGLASWVTLRSDGFVRLVLFLAPLPLGAIAVWRSLRGAVAPSSRAAALIGYVINPLPYNAIAQGRWQALVVYATIPAVIGRIARAGRWKPFDVVVRAGTSVPRQIIGLGVVLAVASTAAPVVSIVTLVIGLVIIAVLGLLDGEGHPRNAAAVLGGGLLISAAVHLPWTVAVLSAPNRWSVLTGADPTRQTPIGLGRALMFDTGPHGGPLTAGLCLAAFVALAVSARERFRWSLVSVLLILISLGSVVAAGRLAPSVSLPASEVLLGLAAAGAGFGLAFGLEAFRSDVSGRNFGWRQLASVLAAAAVVVASLPFALDVLNGRWSAPVSDLEQALSPIGPKAVPNERVLWIADGDVIAKQGWTLGDGLRFEVTDGVHRTVSALFPQGAGLGEQQLRTVARSMIDGRDSRVGERLSVFGIRYVIVLDRLAPRPYGDATFAVPEAITQRIEQQFDMSRVEVAPGLVVFENLVTRPIRYSLGRVSAEPTATASTATASTVAAGPTGDESAERTPWRTTAAPPTRFTGVPATDRLVVLTNRDGGWSANGAAAKRATEPGTQWAAAFTVKPGRSTELRFATAPVALALHVLQLAVIVGLVSWRRRSAKAAEAVSTGSGEDQ